MRFADSSSDPTPALSPKFWGRVIVADLLKAGLLQSPIEISVPAEYQYYLVAPEAKFRTDKVRAFASWIMGEVAS